MTRVAPVNAPRREVHSDDIPTRTLPPIDDTDNRPNDSIVTLKELPDQDYMDELAFMREPVTIVLNRGREKFAPRFEQFGVNGRLVWVETGKPTTLPRCYIEVIARSQPIDIRTTSGEVAGDELTFNRVERTQSAAFSFSVIKDDNPKGAAWLSQIIREG